MTTPTPEAEAAAREWLVRQCIYPYLQADHELLRQALARFYDSARAQGREAGLEEAAKWHEAEGSNWMAQQEVCLPDDGDVQRSRNRALWALGAVQQSYAAMIRALKSPSEEASKP